MDTVAAFYAGLAALQVGDDLYAEAKLSEVTRLAPGEPAGWANWGVLALRQRSLEAAAQRLGEALKLAPKDDHLYDLEGIVERERGHTAQAITALRKSAELNPHNLRTLYTLAQEVERQGGEGSETEFEQLLNQILAQQPDNLATLVEVSRIAAKRADAATVRKVLEKIGAQSAPWPAEVRDQYTAVESAAAEGDFRGVAARTVILRNALMRVPEYRQSRSAIKAAPGEEAEPLGSFVILAAPVVRAAAADTAIQFEAQPLSGFTQDHWSWVGAIQLDSVGAPVVAVANGEKLILANGATLPFPGGPHKVAPAPEGVLQVDLNYDFKTDLVLAGAGGVRLFRQDAADRFVDVSSDTKLPKAILQSTYTGAWAVDIEADGDLDIVLAAPTSDPLVLRNNGDGSFEAIHPFPEVKGLRQFAWVDLDGDGNPDAAMIDGSGRLRVFINERQGQFRERALPVELGPVLAIAVGEVGSDGPLDLVILKADGILSRLADRNQGESWDVANLGKLPPDFRAAPENTRVRVADLDNNGKVDLVVSSFAAIPQEQSNALLWLSNEKGEFAPLEHPRWTGAVYDVADLAGRGRLDTLGLTPDGQPIQGVNQGTKNYHWQTVRPHAAQAFGDQRINPFGVGGEVEIRAGLLTQKQPITGPQVHFGLGEQTSTDVIRVIWPNGAVRAEFAVKSDQEIATEQRLKGSCPFLFAFDGKAVRFVKDAVPWSSAIGLRINTLGSADIAATEEWYKIGRDQLVPHDGYYDLRITAELWEVYYYDYLALMTVDHPAGTEVFVDERFVIPPAPLAITTVATPHNIERAVNDQGQDVTGIVRDLDGKVLHDFGRGQYQGITRDHYVEVDLGEAVPQSGPLYLIAQGSIYPTDSSINVAMTQGTRWRAQGLSLEVPDGHGGWIVAQPNLGFPAGRIKTILIDLTNAFRPGTPRRVRLRTNLEIYWDQIQWAQGRPDVALKTTRMDPSVADLHYRGYSVISHDEAGGPELPDYSQLSGTKQRWRDLIGYYTRFGDVRELLAKVDDRYVIMNSGDEMTFHFPEQPPPPDGWVRDFVIVGDGWIKDGDYNSTFSKTVLPLPYHAEREYKTAPGRLEDEKPYRAHPEDWQNFHTRYVTPDEFDHALRAAASK